MIIYGALSVCLFYVYSTARQDTAIYLSSVVLFEGLQKVQTVSSADANGSFILRTCLRS